MSRTPLSTFDDTDDASVFAESLSDLMSEVATELLEGNTDKVKELMEQIDRGMESLEDYLGIGSYEDVDEED